MIVILMTIRYPAGSIIDAYNCVGSESMVPPTKKIKIDTSRTGEYSSLARQ